MQSRLTVAIPARDEADYVVRALEALAEQVGVDGKPLEHGLFDIVVFANNCRDDTADAVRRFAARLPQIATDVIEDDLPLRAAHVGMARRCVLDRCARRFLEAGRADGVLASTDADTVVAPDWVAWTLREIKAVDAVAGFVDIDALERQRLMAPVRLLYARERAYRRALAELQVMLDPQPEDPEPRHASFIGASFAVTARAYVAAGGLPPLAALEDLAFCAALRRIDARVRHSMRVRATTSAGGKRVSKTDLERSWQRCTTMPSSCRAFRSCTPSVPSRKSPLARPCGGFGAADKTAPTSLPSALCSVCPPRLGSHYSPGTFRSVGCTSAS